MNTFIFPSDPFYKNAVDQEFAHQAEAVTSQGNTVVLFDIDELGTCKTSNRKLTLRYLGGRILPKGNASITKAVYRGWMLSVHQYSALELSLRSHGIKMLTEMPQYLTAHELPGWYKEFENITANTVWYYKGNPQPLAEIVAPLDSTSFIVKDFVKSRKHEWNTACYIPTMEALEPVVNEFIRLGVEEENANRGIVLRKFENFDKNFGEVRAWWVKGQLAMVTSHPDTPSDFSIVDPCFLEVVRLHVERLGCPFVTTDITKLTDGRWMVVEVGDGQVSGLPAYVDGAPLWEALTK